MKMMPAPIRYYIYTGQELPAARPYGYVLAREGIYKLADTPFFTVSLLLARVRRGVPGLEEFGEWAVVSVPRIPARWLRSVLEHARKAGRGHGVLRPIEQMYHFHYFFHDPDDGMNGSGWRVAVPKQQASAGQVRYMGGDERTVVLDLHSHHEMAPFFSTTDNRDEQGLRFYAVIGHIYSRPQIRLRLGVYGDFVELPVTVLFEGLGPFEDCYDDGA